MKAILMLEDGAFFEGNSFGVAGERNGDVVFNTSMTGYQEILTDPSYKGQLVCMTYTLIGNYGLNKEDNESKKPWLECFIVKENSKLYSNWRAGSSLHDFFLKHNVMGIEGIDTRALTRHIRQKGAMRAIVSSKKTDIKKLFEKVKASPSLMGSDLVKEVSSEKSYIWNEKGKYNVVVIDCGVKYNILRKLAKLGCRVIVVPARTSAEDILKFKPDGVLISNGPGDPAAVTYTVDTVRALLGRLPIFGICLGHQILGLAMGGKTYKLKFGHHGANHPVKNIINDRISITSQNHGFCVDMNSLKGKGVELTHINLNDNTVEGIKCKKLNAFAVQFHPEAAPGPTDAEYLFEEFKSNMKQYKKSTIYNYAKKN